ncbi:unnamed protein product [Closterium sp. NIES-54]
MEALTLGLQGRVALVAAASAGLGYHCALAFARAGARVAIFSRSPERIEAAAKKIRGEMEGAQVLPLVADVLKTDELQAVVDATQTERAVGTITSLWHLATLITGAINAHRGTAAAAVEAAVAAVAAAAVDDAAAVVVCTG